jgi:hypothetical protein
MILKKEHVEAFSEIKGITSSKYSNLGYELLIANSQVVHNLSKIDAMMQEIPCKIGYSLKGWPHSKIGYSLKGWPNGIDVEVLKKESNLHFDLL